MLRPSGQHWPNKQAPVRTALTWLAAQGVSLSPRLQPVTLQVAAGSLIHLIGPNGAGKSTLLAALAGIIPASGVLTLLGRPLAAYSRADLAARRAWLSQQAQPASASMPVFQYLALHQPAAADEATLDRTVAMLTEALALSDKLTRALNQLSGGEWQRVRLAAVLLQVWPSVNPHAGLLLLDEPAASLDIAQRVALDSLLAQLTAAGHSVLVCSHDLNHSRRHADRVWLMDKGRLIADGTAAQVMQPAAMSPVFGVNFEQVSAAGVNWLMATALMTEE